MGRKVFMLFCLVLNLMLLNGAPLLAGEQPSGTLDKVQEQVNSVDLSKVESFIGQIDQETRSYFPQLDLKNLLANLKSGKVNLQPQAIFSGIIKLLFKEVAASAGLMAKLVVLAVLLGILQHLQNAFEGSVGKVAQSMSYLVLITIALASLGLAVDTGKNAIDSMVGFMQALLPVLLTLLVALGNITSAAIFHPFVMAALSFLATVIKSVVLPLVSFGAILAVINHISDNLKVSKLASLFNWSSKVVLGFSLTVFIGIMTVQGVAGSISDGVAMRSAKFATDAFVPVVGRWFSDAVELVVGSALLLKNAVGLVGIIVVLLLTIAPVIKIVSIMVIYRVAAALVQPLGTGSLAEALQAMSSSLSLVFACVASVAVMFFMAVSVILATANLSVMLR